MGHYTTFGAEKQVFIDRNEHLVVSLPWADVPHLAFSIRHGADVLS